MFKYQVLPHNLVQVGPGIWRDRWKGTIFGRPRYSHTTWDKSDLGFGMMDGSVPPSDFPGIPIQLGILHDALVKGLLKVI